ncbi:hypothetical protein D3C78_958430 [compost metagenome]
MALYQIGTLQGHLGHAHGRVERPERVVEHALVVWGVLADGQGQRAPLAAAPGAAGALQVVGRVRGDVVHRHHADTADIHAHFHGGRAAQQVQLAGLEQAFVAVQLVLRLLRRVFGGTEVVATLDDQIHDVRPERVLAQLLDPRLAVQPVADRQQTLVARQMQECLGQTWQGVGCHLDGHLAVGARRVGTELLERGVDEAPRHRAQIDCFGQPEAQILEVKLVTVAGGNQ